MFWKRSDKDQKNVKLSGPRDLPEPVKKYLAADPNIDPGIIPFLKVAMKNGEKGDRVFDVRVFDPADAEAKGVKIQDYSTFNANPDLIIGEGYFDEAAKKADLTLKKSVQKIKFFTYEEILNQIKSLKDPGSYVFFYTNAGAGVGGPLGRGAALIRLNTAVEGKKVKKYSVYGVSIINMQPVQNENKIFDSDKPEEIAKWVASAHKPRFC